MELKIYQNVFASLLSCEPGKFSGFVFGYDNIVIGSWICKSNYDEFCKSYGLLQSMLPLGISIFGILIDGDNIDDSISGGEIGIDVNFLIFRNSNAIAAHTRVDKTSVNINILESHHFDNERFGILHATTALRVYIEHDFDSIEGFIRDHFGQILMQFSSGYTVSFSPHDENDDVPTIGECLGGQLNLEASTITENTIELNDSKTKSKSKTNKRPKKASKTTTSSKKTTTNSQSRNDLVRTPREELSWGTVYHIGTLSASPPLIVSNVTPLSSLIDINLSLLCYTRMDSPVNQVATQIQEGFTRLAINAMMTVHADYPNLPYLQAQYRHHCPQSLHSPITLLHILSAQDSSSSTKVNSTNFNSMPNLEPISDQSVHGQNSRKLLHAGLGLPLDRPLFRYNCSESFTLDNDSLYGGEVTEANNNISNTDDIEFANVSQSNIKSHKLFDNGKIINVHEGLGESGIRNGKTYLVQGPYAYYHYLQDGINDKGWGCAYRSLQTIVSWFVLNHYISNKVPSHVEVQRSLVKIGDKPTSFIGSNEWIGSTEIGFFLDAEYEITWKSIFISSGDELASKARELAVHFQEQGIDWCSDSGDVKFLILDPHYCGADDLALIQTKVCMMEGYKATAVGWRSCSSFNKNSFYNLCLPQRPKNAF